MESHHPHTSQPGPMASVTSYGEIENPVNNITPQEQIPCIISDAHPTATISPEKTQSKSYPKGYLFNPTDEELITYYLMEKISNNPIPIEEMYDVDLYQHSPAVLTENYTSLGKNEWFFFTPRDRKYPNGTRPNRAAGSGFWKATGADKLILNENNETIGLRKALVFYEGKPPDGVKTEWIMHEFKANMPPRNKRNAEDMRLDDWVLCRVYLKTPKPKKKQSKVKTNRRSRLNTDPLGDENINNNLVEVTQQEGVEEVELPNGLTNNNSEGYVTQDYQNDNPSGLTNYNSEGYVPEDYQNDNPSGLSNYNCEVYVTQDYQNGNPSGLTNYNCERYVPEDNQNGNPSGLTNYNPEGYVLHGFQDDNPSGLMNNIFEGYGPQDNQNAITPFQGHSFQNPGYGPRYNAPGQGYDFPSQNGTTIEYGCNEDTDCLSIQTLLGSPRVSDYSFN